MTDDYRNQWDGSRDPDERFVQQHLGLHHLCLRVRSREDVDRCAALLKEMDATIVRGPMEGSWAPGY
jgi:hypothetical protein